MAVFQILATRRSSLNSSEFDVRLLTGSISPYEIFTCDDRGAPFEYVIRTVDVRPNGITLSCLNWVLHDGHLVGMEVESRPMKSAEAKRYRKLLPG
jgi:hypothetical protein